jgi:cyclopropane-fatty-acyl-phospholipid synthase
MAAAEAARLWVLDCEILRLHYADTLAAWRERFLAVRPQVEAMQGERFATMWELYLASCEAAFRHGRAMVFQLQLGRRRDAVPTTRGYLAEAEAAFAKRERDVVRRLFESTDAVLGPPPAVAQPGRPAGTAPARAVPHPAHGG